MASGPGQDMQRKLAGIGSENPWYVVPNGIEFGLAAAPFQYKILTVNNKKASPKEGFLFKYDYVGD